MMSTSSKAGRPHLLGVAVGNPALLAPAVPLQRVRILIASNLALGAEPTSPSTGCLQRAGLAAVTLEAAVALEAVTALGAEQGTREATPEVEQANKISKGPAGPRTDLPPRGQRRPHLGLTGWTQGMSLSTTAPL